MTGITSVPSPYYHLYFSSYNVLKPRDHSLDGKISKHDLNCAVSSPNALIGSRYTSDSARSSKGAFFEVANASSMAEDGLKPYFTLKTFNIKPMDAPPAVISVTIRGYSHARGNPFTWSVDFPIGFHKPFLVKMQEYSGERWNQVYRVEITADYGEDFLDWEFCLDDLEVQFFESEEEMAAYERINQAILKDHS